MNDEIKEIIEYFKDDIDYLEEELKYPNFKGRYITIRDKECEYLRKLLNYITNLQQEKDSFEKIANQNYKVANDYKSRNEKAIEIIKTYSNTLDTRGVLLYSNLLNILQGSDKKSE